MGLYARWDRLHRRHDGLAHGLRGGDEVVDRSPGTSSIDSPNNSRRAKHKERKRLI